MRNAAYFWEPYLIQNLKNNAPVRNSLRIYPFEKKKEKRASSDFFHIAIKNNHYKISNKFVGQLF